MSDQDLREGHPGPPPDSPVERLATHQAAANNNVAELADLVKDGSPMIGIDTKETPLHAAAKKGAADTLRWLLDNGTVSPLEKAGNGNSAAHYAAVYGHLEVLKLLVEHDRGLSTQVVSQVDESGLSLISLATLQGDKEMAMWLVDNYPEVGDIPNANGNLPVHFAAAQGHLSILKLLVRQYGKEILEQQDKNSTKPVYFASQEGQLTILDYLINELGVDPVAREKSGVSTVHAAVQAGRYKAVKWLISKLGTKYILDKTIDGATPLHMAAAQGHTDILHYLLENMENKDDVNVLDHIHATPAHDAAEYGQMESMLLLLRNGADISIKDTENKTPYELALEQNHPEVAAMIADLRDNGPAALSKYDKKKRAYTQPTSMMHPRTTREVAEELSAAIKQTTHLQEHRKNQQLQRQESLQKMNEKGLEEDGKKSDEDEIEHTLGPKGDIYARPKKRKHRNKTGSRQGSDDDILDDPRSPRSQQKSSLLDAILPMDDSTYASVNHETASNYSRPSRVKRYHDSDSEITSVSSQYRDGRHNMPGVYPPYGGYYPPQPALRRGQHSSASSVHSSRTGRPRKQGYPMMPYGPYGYYPMPYPPYGYPYPHYGQPGYRPKTTEDRMHLAALQTGQGGHMMGQGGHMMGAHPMYYYQPMRGRRSKLKKRTRSRQPSRDPSPPGVPRKHTDDDMGYGPAVQKKNEGSIVGGAKGKRGGAKGGQSGFHPQAPPVTGTDGAGQAGDAVVNFDGNFIMMKKSDTLEQVKQLGDTTLHMAKAPKHYDGRWDSYIMTDSEPEHEVDETYCVAFAAETAAILAIGCVSGLKGLKKFRKGPQDATTPDKAYLSSAWDEPPMPTKSRSRRASISGVADPTLKDVSPEDFAAREEMTEQAGWSGGEKKSKGKKSKKSKDGSTSAAMKRSASAEAFDNNPQSELLAGELEKQGYASVSRNFGQKMLSDALGARESSMLNIASTSLAGSMMSLDHSGEEGQDDFNETIHMVHGTKKVKKLDGEDSIQQERVEGQTDQDEKRPRSDKKNDKQKVKEEKARKEREKEEKRREKKEAKKDKKQKKKKDEQKKANKEEKENTKETSTAATVEKPSPPIPVRSAPPPPRPTSGSSERTGRTVAPKEPHRLTKPSSQQQRSRPPSAQRYQYKEQQKPTATSTPVSKDGVASKADRKEKAQLKSSQPTKPVPTRPAPTKQMSHQLDREEKQTSAPRPKRIAPKAELKGPTEKKNTYFDDESDEEEIAAGEKRAQQTQTSKPKLGKEKKVDANISELDDVLAQLESIQTGGLMSWLEPNSVTRVDDSEDSEDSLPLIVPSKPPWANKKQQQSPAMAQTSSGPQSRSRGNLGEDESHVASAAKSNRLLPPQVSDDRESSAGWRQGGAVKSNRLLPLQVSDDRESSAGWRQGGAAKSNRLLPPQVSDDRESESNAGWLQDGEFVALQRTKHGSPHPAKRGAMKTLESPGSTSHDSGSNGKVSASADLKPTLDLKSVRHETDVARDGDQRSAFEQSVMSTLAALTESMNQLKGNPSITQTEITEQTQLQQQLIQNLVTYSQHDPQLVSRLISLITEKNPEGMESSSSSHQLEQLQQKILGAHEKTYQETQEHFRNQEALQRAIQQTLEEQTQQQMKGMQANFEMFTKLMEEQLAEQRRKFEEELKKREVEEQEEKKEKRKKKKNKDHGSKKKDRKKRHKRYSDSESDSSDSDDEGTMVLGKTVNVMPAVKTMEAKIFTQDLLTDEPQTPTPGKGRGKLVRRGTEAELSRTTEALIRNLPIGQVEEDEEEEEEEEEMFFQHARPVTIRRADIKVQPQVDFTPYRPSSARSIHTEADKFDDFHMLKKRPPKQFKTPEKKQEFDEKNLRYGKQHVEVNERQKPAEDVNPLAGAGGELAAALKVRQKQLKNREHK